MTEAPGSRVWAWLRAEPLRFDVAVAAFVVCVGALLISGSPDPIEVGWPDWLTGLGAFVLLSLRSRHPRVLFVIAALWTVIHVGIVGQPTPMVFAALVLLSTVCVRLERWQAIALAVPIGGTLYLGSLLSNETELADARSVIILAWTGLAVGVADARRSWLRYRESSEAQLRSAVLAADARARQDVVEERLTIARELHDLLAHNLSVMNVQTGAAAHLLRSDPDQAEASLAAARQAGRSVLDELSELLAVLRKHDQDGAPTTSLPDVDDVETLVDTMRAAGLSLSWRQVGEHRTLAPAVSLAAYRIIQESLTNAAKHGSGDAELTTEWTEDRLTVQVSNATAAAPGDGSGQGLVGMRERATLNGGGFSSTTGNGRFVVDAWLPVAQQREMTP